MPKQTKAQAAKTVLDYLQGPEGRAQLEKVQNIPAARSTPADLVALAIETSGDEDVIAAWELSDQKQVLVELVKPHP